MDIETDGLEEPITVGQLIGRLKQIPLDTTVRVEGCDCWGDCSGVSYPLDLSRFGLKEDGSKQCLIRRFDGVGL